MVTWNYRVFQEVAGDYIIREVFYGDAGEILGCTEGAIEPKRDSIAALAQDLVAMQQALQLPVMTLAEIPTSPAMTVPRHRETVTHDQVLAQLGLSDSAIDSFEDASV
ncbi:hypothetical protein [Leptolyngbya sp. PCC 6406]|uniref:hypothetical protein n=1 Tax=Leptolyngbya sp. PCC 6406 TaxID=1173264 RepID=UPI0002ABAE60|nr:hypothetical protein [Leptolyngbya sp. PCC 6406]